MDNLKVVFIGFGSIAKKHFSALKSLINCETYALRSSIDALPILDVSNIFSFQEIADINPHFVIISNPTYKHEETIMKLIPFGIPLFIEKPSLFRLVNADRIDSLLSEGKINTYVACNLRFLDCLIFLRDSDILSDNRLNEVNVYAGSYLPAWRPDVNFKEIYSANKDMGGGVHLDMIHELDYMYWLFGKPERVHSNSRSVSSLQIDAIDSAHYNLIYPEFTANVTLNYFRRDYKRTLELVFHNATYLVDLKENSVTKNGDELIYKSDQKIVDTYLRQMKYFIKYISDPNANSLNSFTDSINVLKIALA
ncbi:Gfo/Idh/MocA family oxidoreductase [Saprospiraceae bacterium]|nr:Gfo/Idh/MocA family oxidoreductase [Saprospiraceae bacterium]